MTTEESGDVRKNEEATADPTRAPRTVADMSTLVDRLQRTMYFVLFVCALLFVYCVGLSIVVLRVDDKVDNITDATELANAAIAGQVRTAERTECRAQITSDYTSAQWSDLAAILVKAFNGDREGGADNAQAMATRESIDDQVARLCPQPIAEVEPGEVTTSTRAP